ncbi:MAG TPA: zf-HC2 domain-containing protein [Verrucomicrobiae bacterium]|jgi:anti-sigma factor RsiW
MNCQTFIKQFPEHLDETLPAAESAEAREHVVGCEECRRAMARHTAFAKSIRLSLEREVEGLWLAAETRRNILLAAKRPERREIFALFWRHPIWTAAVVLVVAAGIFRGSRRRPDVCVVDVPIRTETHFYQRQKGSVVDDVVTEITVIDAAYSEKINHDKL